MSMMSRTDKYVLDFMKSKYVAMDHSIRRTTDGKYSFIDGMMNTGLYGYGLPFKAERQWNAMMQTSQAHNFQFTMEILPGADDRCSPAMFAPDLVNGLIYLQGGDAVAASLGGLMQQNEELKGKVQSLQAKLEAAGVPFVGGKRTRHGEDPRQQLRDRLSQIKEQGTGNGKAPGAVLRPSGEVVLVSAGVPPPPALGVMRAMGDGAGASSSSAVVQPYASMFMGFGAMLQPAGGMFQASGALLQPPSGGMFQAPGAVLQQPSGGMFQASGAMLQQPSGAVLQDTGAVLQPSRSRPRHSRPRVQQPAFSWSSVEVQSSNSAASLGDNVARVVARPMLPGDEDNIFVVAHPILPGETGHPIDLTHYN